MVVMCSHLNYFNELCVINVDTKLFVIKLVDNTFISVVVPYQFFFRDISVYFTYDL